MGTHFKHHVGYTGYLDNYGLRGTDIICKVAAQTPEAAFHIVGGAPDIVKHWQRFSEQYNQYDNIFFYGYRNPEEMPYFLSCFDVVLAPLQFRPLLRAPTGQNMSPLKLPQYMGYEKAIVASDIPSHQEVLKNNHNAILVPCDDVSRWSEAINNLLEDQDLRMIMGANAKDAYYSEFTPQLRVERILENIVL
jgi:glycosyltransferase involved in cell wall biosynthesis